MFSWNGPVLQVLKLTEGYAEKKKYHIFSWNTYSVITIQLHIIEPIPAVLSGQLHMRLPCCFMW